MGYCVLHGFRIKSPYLFQELADSISAPHAPRNENRIFTFPPMGDIDYKREEDDKVLSMTELQNYWWMMDPEDIWQNRTDYFHTINHFARYFHAVQDAANGPEDIEFYTEDNIDVPGFAPRNPPVNISPSGGPRNTLTCTQCEPMRQAVVTAYHKVEAVKRRLDEALRVEEETINRTEETLTVYQALQEINTRHGKPFQDGPSLPLEYAQMYLKAPKLPPVSIAGRTLSMSSEDSAPDLPQNPFYGSHRDAVSSGQRSGEDRRTPSTQDDEAGSSGTSIPSDIDPPSESDNNEGWEGEYSDDSHADSRHGSPNN